jgi:uncharacterized protein DUF3634
MGDWLIRIAVLGFLAWAAWMILEARYVFLIRVESGQPRLRKGWVTAAFLAQVAEACATGGVERGWVGGVRAGRRTALQFSRSFPPGVRQQLRNEWQMDR